MSTIICFPQQRNVGKARHVATLFLRKATAKEQQNYWQQICSRLTGSMVRAQIPEAEIERQLDAFRGAVQREIDGASNNQQLGPGAA